METLDTKKEHEHEWQLFRVKSKKGQPPMAIAVCKICLEKKEVLLVPNQPID